MIQPLSLNQRTAVQTITANTASIGEKAGDEVHADLFTIASGALEGRDVAFLRSTSDDEGETLWLVATTTGEHVGMAETMESALHLIMAQAYKLAAAAIDAKHKVGKTFREGLAELEAFDAPDDEILQWDNGLCVGIAKNGNTYAANTIQAATRADVLWPVRNGNNEAPKPVRRREAVAAEIAKLTHLLQTYC